MDKVHSKFSAIDEVDFPNWKHSAKILTVSAIPFGQNEDCVEDIQYANQKDFTSNAHQV